MKDEKSIDQQRVPFIGDMPVLGTLFRNTKESSKKTELVVFLKPRIITGRRQNFLESAQEQAPPPTADLTLEVYQRILQDRILKVVRVQETVSQARGKVVVEFTLTPEGRLHGSPRIQETQTEALKPLAQQAVLVASPFPPLPRSLPREPKTFQFTLDYE